MRPVFDRLPESGYQDNPVVSAILAPYEERLSAVAENMSSFWQRLTLLEAEPESLQDFNLNPLTTQQLVGFYFEVKVPTIFTILSLYPVTEQGLPHQIRIVSRADNSTAWERGFSGQSQHTYTDVKLVNGSYFIYTNYSKTTPLRADNPYKHGHEKWSVDYQARYISSSDGSQTASLDGIVPLYIHEQTNSERALAESLDFTAYLLGLTGQYWNTGWDFNTKKALIKNANQIQQWRGTERGLRLVLDSHAINYRIWGSKNALTLSFPVGAQTSLGVNSARTFVRLPLTSNKGSREYIEAQRAVNNYSSLVSNVMVCYNGFYLGYSTVGEPLFN